MRHALRAIIQARLHPVWLLGRGVAISAVALLCSSPSAHAQFISIVSGNGSANNLTIDTNGSIVASNAASVLYSNSGPTIGGTTYAGYNLSQHLFGTPSTPGTAGYSTTPVVGVDGSSGNYAGGPVSITDPNGTTLTSENITPYGSGATSGDVGYFMYTVNFTVSSASASPFKIIGYGDSDNEVQDVILDYGTTSVAGTTTQTGTVLNLTALDGTEIQTTNNQASHVQYQTTSAASNLAGSHSLSFIVYNTSGPTDFNFGFTAYAVPEPITLSLFGLGLPAALGLYSRRGKRLSR